MADKDRFRMKYMRALLIILLFVVTVPVSAFAESPLWQDVKESFIAAASGQRAVVPKNYRTLRLNTDAMSQLLAGAPMEFTEAAANGAVLMTIPMPDGSLARFRIQESPISAPDPSGKVSEFRSYSGQGIDDPTATMRCDISPAGFHAQILSAGEPVYVDPYTLNDTTNFISYYRRDAQRQGAEPLCFAAELQSPTIKQLARAAIAPTAPNGPSGSVLRTVRSAFAATGEYTTFFRQAGDTDAQAKTRALNAIKVTLNRVNGIWEKDAAVRYVLLADATELTIIYTDPNTDPYTNNNASKLSDENQANLDNVIGNANYDHGHVVSTSPGGEGTGGVCVTGDKAKGVTGSDMPVGDPFDVDFVAHEIIHQWNGNHTFNANMGGQCTNANRNGPTAYEPGSGSTTSSYAGICAVENLQMNSDDYFHGASIQEILTWLNTTGNCAATVNTGNTPPTVTAPVSFTIPRNTPFTLTATASDPNGDTLTYSWEEFDIGAASPPEADDGTRPIFRPYKPTTSPSRTFPSLTYILNNANVPPATFTGTSATGTVCGAGQTCISGEVMPSTTRTMNFRVQVRDNRAGGGGINDATTQVMVRADSGPFVVTAPNTGVTVAGGSQLNVTWNVANTTAAPVSAANVKISLSTDGGNTFPNLLAASVPNNGSANVTMPNVGTTTARIKVEAVGNIFFDISDTNFTITGPAASPTPTATATPTSGLVANVSTRLPVRIGDNPLIEGFIVQGPAGSTKKIIVRAIGPSLVPFGIADALANPTLDIFDSNNTKIASNDNWKTTQVGGIITGDQVAEINASNLAPGNDAESAIIANLAPGSYTAVVRGAGNTEGTAVVDAYDLSTGSAAQVKNIATRGLVQPADKLMIAGFIIQNGSVKVVVSALGPSLAQFGITNALPDTTLELRNANGTFVMQNDDWMTTQKTELQATGLQPTNNLEAAIVATLPPDQYSALVRGKPEQTGTGVVQVFFLQ